MSSAIKWLQSTPDLVNSPDLVNFSLLTDFLWSKTCKYSKLFRIQTPDLVNKNSRFFDILPHFWRFFWYFWSDNRSSGNFWPFQAYCELKEALKRWKKFAGWLVKLKILDRQMLKNSFTDFMEKCENNQNNYFLPPFLSCYQRSTSN